MPKFREGDAVILAAAQVEFRQDGNTMWIHAPNGSTLLRLKTTGKIRAEVCATSPVAHADITVEGDIVVCIPKK